MARHSRFFSFACGYSLVLVLILCQEVVHVEARHLRVVSKTHHHHRETGPSVGRSFGGGEGISKRRTRKVEHVADLRSTEPGHSPGVGHSINN